MNQLRVARPPDALGKLVKDQRKILLQRAGRQLLPRVALNGLLHRAQFGQARLKARDATLHLRPRLLGQRVLIHQRGADVHQFVRENGRLREGNPPQCPQQLATVGIEKDDALPVRPLLFLHPTRVPQGVEHRARLVPHRRGLRQCLIRPGQFRVFLDHEFHHRQRLIAIQPLRPLPRLALQGIQHIHVKPCRRRREHTEKIRTQLAEEG